MQIFILIIFVILFFIFTPMFVVSLFRLGRYVGKAEADYYEKITKKTNNIS